MTSPEQTQRSCSSQHGDGGVGPDWERVRRGVLFASVVVAVVLFVVLFPGRFSGV
jgi:hypothetical protein